MELNSSLFESFDTGSQRWLVRAGQSVLGLNKLDSYYRQRPNNMSTRDFLRFMLNKLGIDYFIASGNCADIAEQGATIVVANHPFGGAESLMVAELLLKHRTDVKVLANDYLHRVAEISELLIGLDIFDNTASRRANIQGINEAVQHLKNDGLLLIFPAGEVSSLQLKQRTITDKKWSRVVAMLVRKTQAKTVPLYIEGKNSKWFYLAGIIHPRLRTLLLVREMLNKNKRPIKLHVGQAIPYSELKTLSGNQAMTDYLRLNTYLLNCQASNKADIAEKNNVSMQNIALPVARKKLQDDVDALDNDALLLSKGDFDVYCAKAQQLPHILLEIGRLREITFREVAEGTGRANDLDEFDQYYLHMFIWNKEQQEIVGAYRLGLLDQIVNEHGINALYTRSLFRYDKRFLEDIGISIEMGRSFIRSEYQRSLSALFLLWKGIACFASNNPQYTTLFGPVSISSGYSELSRNLMMEFLQLHHYDHKRAKMIKATHPQKKSSNVFWTRKMLEALKDNQLISKLIYRMEGDKGLPVLLKQYLGLNGKLVSFNIDKTFNDALDGMIIVDLLQTSERLLAKYMGKEKAKIYLNR